MLRIALARSASLSAALILLAPALGGAELLCQHKKSRRLLVASECPRKYERVLDLGSSAQSQGALEARAAELETRADELETDVTLGLGSLAGLNARFPVSAANLANSAVTGEKVAANAIDASKVADGSLGLGDLAAALVLPYPGLAAGDHWRVVAADLDLSDESADNDSIEIDRQSGGPWLVFAGFDPAEISIDLAIADGIFSAPPHCVVSLSRSGSPNAAQNLEAALVGASASTVRVRVVGSDRRFNVRGTLLCFGAAGDA